ncbi:hypothetical protein BBF96_15465 [Anoxybacter fermentans]|uniref:DUF2268 domain-containing protein n=1 Tax=Anoxybacter fermentans TaxID=1323375 RepID=A0A3S9T285_9FIRM|nr:DUF5700 domain-containing putative Zn-dependent protease [Anoxybacter fermentans]AZR74648.1 hypothetical protein BBF96_15465 [Anoxybacter fermentans]
MINFKSDLLELMLNNSEQVFSLKHKELELIESYINSFGTEETIPPISQLKDKEKLEEYYSYLSFLKYKDDIKDLAFRIQNLPPNKLLSFVSQLFDLDQEPITIYLTPIGNPIGEAYVRNVDGRFVAFVNLSAIMRYSNNSDERIAKLIPVLEHEIFHILFGRFYTHSSYWKIYQKDLTQLKKAKLLILDEGIGHFIGDRVKIEEYLDTRYEILRKTFINYQKVINKLTQGDLPLDEAKKLFIKGIAGPYFEKYFAIPGMIAVHIIYKEYEIEGIKRCLKDMSFFEECGLKKLNILFQSS